MKISCPQCGTSGTLPVHEIPEAGRFMSCPRCHFSFTVTRPRSSSDSYLVDTCPACHFSTFGDETFGTCPKCGIVVKTYIERQREEQRQQNNQKLLTKTFNHNDSEPLPPEPEATPVADFLDNLHPVNLIGWGVAAAAVIIMISAVWGLLGYDSTAIQSLLTEQRDEPVSGWYVFFYFGALYWLRLFYGMAVGVTAVLFIKRLHRSLKPLRWLIRAAVAYLVLSYLVNFVLWFMAPIPHTIIGYLVEFLNVVIMSGLFGIPLFMLERYLRSRIITTVVRL
jgi:hypothetical protein